MSYYEEVLLDNSHGSSIRLTWPDGYTRVSFSQPRNPLKIGYLMTYRSGPGRGISQPIPDHIADPYAGFLDSTYSVRSKKNGVEFKPDTGHAFSRRLITTTGLRSLHWNNDVRNPSYQMVGIAEPQIAKAGEGFPGNNAGFFTPTWADDRASFGQQAIARTAPQAAVFSMSQFLGELREGLPKLVGASLLKGRTKDFLKSSGSEYLNVQFGWLPFVSDIQALCRALLDTDSILRQARGLQGKPSFRRWHPEPIIASRTTTSSGPHMVNLYNRPFSAGLPTFLEKEYLKISPSSFAISSQATQSTVIETLERRRWFEGSFTSYFDYPDVDASWVEKAKSLMQLELTPEVLWELAPWSWLVDWVFQIQSSIASNAVANNERVIMNYGYVMEESIYRRFSYGTLANTASNIVYGALPYATTVEDIRQTRIRANPFGFQAKAPSQFNVKQLSILAALGLSFK